MGMVELLACEFAVEVRAFYSSPQVLSSHLNVFVIKLIIDWIASTIKLTFANLCGLGYSGMFSNSSFPVKMFDL